MMRADCQNCLEQLDDYLSSELLVETTREVLRHTAACTDCREELERRQALRQQLRRAVCSSVPDSIGPRLLAALNAATQEPPRVDLAPHTSGLDRESRRQPQLGTAARHWWKRLGTQGHRLFQPGLWPWWVRQPAAVALFAMCVAVMWYRGVGVPVSAAELLERSTEAERGYLAAPEVSLRRVLTLEERAVPSGAVLGHQRVEIWHDNRTGITARRAFTDAHQLIAGEWTDRVGHGTVYRRGSSPEHTSQPSPRARARALIAGGEPWRLGLTADEFATLIPPDAIAEVTATAHEYELTFVNPSANDGDPVRRGSVTLTRPALHPIRQTLIVESAGRSREYELTEREFATVATEQVAQTAFAPDEELTRLPATRLGFDNRLLMPRGLAPADARLFEPPRTDPALEIDLLYRLHRVDACVLEGAEVLRGEDGILTVGVVATSADRQVRILEAMAPVTDDPAVAVQVTLAMPVADANVPLSVDVPRTEMPAYAALRRYFIDSVSAGVSPGQQLPADELSRSIDDAIDRLALRVRDRAARARRHAEALRSLVGRFETGWPSAVDLDVVATWQTMVRDHARAFRHETEAVRLELQPVFFAAAPLEPPSQDVPESEAPALPVLVEQLVAAARLNERTVETWFAAHQVDVTRDHVDSALFWSSLLLCERVSAEFDRPWLLSEPVR